jgi:hypothetical protein
MTLRSISKLLAIFQFAFLASTVSCSGHTTTSGLRGNLQQVEEPVDKLRVVRRELQTVSVKFSLLNTVSDTLVTDLMQNAVANIGAVPANNLSIEVSVTGANPASVKLSLTGATTITAIEGGTFSLCGNSGRDFRPCTSLILGKYSSLDQVQQDN